MPEGLGDAWRGVEQSNPFLSRAWFELLAEHIAETGALRLYLFADDADRLEAGRPATILPMLADPERQLGLPVRRVASLSNFYSPLFSPIAFGVPSERLAAHMRELVRSIGNDPSRWAVVRLAPMDAEDPSFPALEREFRSQGWWTQRYFCFGNWYLPCKSLDFDAYMAARPGRLKSILSRKGRKLRARSDFRVEVISTGSSLADALRAFETVYEESWKPAELYPRFVGEFARMGASKGWTRIGVVSLAGRPIAAQFWLVAGAVAYIFKLAHDPEFHELSPGSLLTSQMLEHVVRHDGVEEVDYLSGDEVYKSMWMTHRRERWGLLAFRKRSLQGSILAARHIGGRALVRPWRSVRGRSSAVSRTGPQAL